MIPNPTHVAQHWLQAMELPTDPMVLQGQINLMWRLMGKVDGNRLPRSTEVRLDNLHYDGNIITAKAKGSNGNYSVRITLSPPGHHCTCPDWEQRARRVGPCKHVAALAQAWWAQLEDRLRAISRTASAIRPGMYVKPLFVTSIRDAGVYKVTKVHGNELEIVSARVFGPYSPRTVLEDTVTITTPTVMDLVGYSYAPYLDRIRAKMRDGLSFEQAVRRIPNVKNAPPEVLEVFRGEVTGNRVAARVRTETATVYALSPDQLYRLYQEGQWMSLAEGQWYEGQLDWTDPTAAMNQIIRFHGGSVFFMGRDGNWDVTVPGAKASYGYLVPYWQRQASEEDPWPDWAVALVDIFEFQEDEVLSLSDEDADELETLWAEYESTDASDAALDAFYEYAVKVLADTSSDTASIQRSGGMPDRMHSLMKFLSGVAKRLGVGEHVYVVGGAVRNFLINQPIKDIDVVIDSVALGGGKDSAWFAQEVARNIPMTTNLVTNQYGVAIVTVNGAWILDGQDMDGEVIEIANARKESYSGAGGKGKGYKPDEVVPATIEEDIFRREFTFNTLLWRLIDLADGPDKDAIIDLTGLGRQHLEERMMHTPLDPDRTFSDDPTRMLRAIKFFVKYSLKLSPEVTASIKRNHGKLADMPWEAVATILVRDILDTPKARQALVIMDSLGLVSVLANMIRTVKPFSAFMAGQMTADKDVQLLLDLAGLGLGDRAVSFLDKDQQDRLRLITTPMSRDEASAFLVSLKQPPVDNMAIIEHLNLAPRDRGVLAPTARRLIMDDPALVGRPDELTRKVEQVLSR